MAIVIVVMRPDKPKEKNEYTLSKKMVLGSSVYCDVVLADKTVGNMQCQLEPIKSGHVIITNLDAKKETFLNEAKIKKAGRLPLRADDVLKVGPFLVRIDPTQITKEELSRLNTEWEEMV